MRRWCGSRLLISALTSAMKVSLSAVRLAHTRLWLGRALGARSSSSPVSKRLSRTCRGVRITGGWLCTVATVAIRFLFGLLPLAAAHDAQRALTKGLARGNV